MSNILARRIAKLEGDGDQQERFWRSISDDELDRLGDVLDRDIRAAYRAEGKAAPDAPDELVMVQIRGDVAALNDYGPLPPESFAHLVSIVDGFRNEQPA